MLRFWYVLIPAFLSGCESLPEARQSSAQFMQLATESKATRLPASVENQRLAAAIAQVDSNQSCTGVLIGKAVNSESPAYLLTAGHCLIDFSDASSSNRIFRDALPRSDRNLVRFPKGEFRIGRVVYATMKGLDLAVAELTDEDLHSAILRLTERHELEEEDAKRPRVLTLHKLKVRGMEPLRWADELPTFGDGIRIISPDAENGSLREHRCRHEGLTDVVENIWHWRHITRNNCEDILPGTSGAPVLNEDSALFAIVNTSSRQALGQDCYLGQPCEMTEQNFQVAAARNYGSPVWKLSACFNAQGVFSLEDSRCPLESSASSVVLQQVRTPINPSLAKAEERRWQVLVRPIERSAGYRYKLLRLPRESCLEAKGYSERLPWSDLRLRDLPLPTEAGLYALCVIPDEDFQSRRLRKASKIIANVDTRMPALKPRLIQNPENQEPLMAVRKSCRKLLTGAAFERRQDCAVAVLSLEMQPYELVNFQYGWTSSKARDCRKLMHEGTGPQATIPVKALPAKLCVWGIDGAGNRAAEPVVFSVRAATRREIIEATDVMLDWSFRLP